MVPHPRRNRAARLRETTTTDTRGGRFSRSGFSGPTGVRGRGTIVAVRLVEARYENGVLLPVDRLGLRPGESVNLIVVRRPVAGRWDLPKLAKAGSAEDLALAEQGLAEWASALETMERSGSEENSGGPASAHIGRANRQGVGPS
jgi:predicted DNA-binding antitoxin AbrB/MazE fold protein